MGVYISELDIKTYRGIKKLKCERRHKKDRVCNFFKWRKACDRNAGYSVTRRDIRITIQ